MPSQVHHRAYWANSTDMQASKSYQLSGQLVSLFLASTMRMRMLSPSSQEAVMSHHQKLAITSKTMAQLLIKAHQHRQKTGCYPSLTCSANDASLLLTALAESILLLVRPARLSMCKQGQALSCAHDSLNAEACPASCSKMAVTSGQIGTLHVH